MKKGMKASEGAGATERGRSPSGVETAPEKISGPDRTGTSAKALRRWSLQRKREAVLRLLRGEPVATVSRELGVEIHRLEEWREKAMLGMDNGLRERSGDPLNAELDQAKKRIGELSMDNELLRLRCEKKLPFPTRRWK
jgi:transposase